MTELHRFLRHALGPVFVILAANGFIPEEAIEGWTEAAVLLLGISLPYLWSKLLDWKGWR